MLTFGQIEEGRLILATSKVGQDEGAAAGWLQANAEALLEAAERVAQDAVRQDIFAGENLTALQAADDVVDSAAKKREEETAAALARIGELEPEFRVAFRVRPLLMTRDQVTTNRYAVSHAELEHWFEQRGVRCRVCVEPGGVIRFERAELISLARRPQLEEQPDGHTMVWVR